MFGSRNRAVVLGLRATGAGPATLTISTVSTGITDGAAGAIRARGAAQRQNQMASMITFCVRAAKKAAQVVARTGS